jgi:hypothetical protein
VAHLSTLVPTTAVSVDPSGDTTWTTPRWIKCTVAGSIVVTPYDGGTDITYVVAAAPDEVPFAVRAVKATGTTVTNGNIIAMKLEA